MQYTCKRFNEFRLGSKRLHKDKINIKNEFQIDKSNLYQSYKVSSTL